MRELGATDAEALFAERRAEDIAVLREAGAAWIHLGLRDALFRRVGEAPTGLPGTGWRATYPTFRFHAGRGRIAAADAEVAAEARAMVADAVAAADAKVVFGPLGTGRHVDHLISREAVAGLGLRAVYYSDFPYSLTADPDAGFIRRASLVPAPWSCGRAENARRMAGYRTQFPGLFPDGVPAGPEIYWMSATDSTTAT